MQTQHLVIRPMQKEDLPSAFAIQSDTYAASLLDGPKAFASRLSTAEPFCLVAVCDGLLVAYLLAYGWRRQSPPPVDMVLSADTPSEVLFIHDLAVSACGQGSGVGRVLIVKAFELARSKGLNSAELIAVEGAGNYWRKLGFEAPPIPPDLAVKVRAYGFGARWMTRMVAFPISL